MQRGQRLVGRGTRGVGEDPRRHSRALRRRRRSDVGRGSVGKAREGRSALEQGECACECLYLILWLPSGQGKIVTISLTISNNCHKVIVSLCVQAKHWGSIKSQYPIFCLLWSENEPFCRNARPYIINYRVTMKAFASEMEFGSHLRCDWPQTGSNFISGTKSFMVTRYIYLIHLR